VRSRSAIIARVLDIEIRSRRAFTHPVIVSVSRISVSRLAAPTPVPQRIQNCRASS